MNTVSLFPARSPFLKKNLYSYGRMQMTWMNTVSLLQMTCLNTVSLFPKRGLLLKETHVSYLT